MAITGRKPVDEATRRNRTAPVHDWTLVVDAPYRGRKPSLPKTRSVVTKLGTVVELPLDKATVRYWRTLSAMPHCALWTAADWEFALATAAIFDMLARGDRGAAGELRLREKTLGTTFESRRDLRIRYVSVESLEEQDNGTPATGRRRRKAAEATVSDLDERRRRLLDGA